jgi:hypothetical protein
MSPLNDDYYLSVPTTTIQVFESLKCKYTIATPEAIKIIASSPSERHCRLYIYYTAYGKIFKNQNAVVKDSVRRYLAA